MHKLKFLTISIILILVLTLIGPTFNVSALGTSPTLVALLDYSVLGGGSVTNTGPTTTDGNVGVSPGSSITNFPPGVAGGNNATHLHSNDASAIAAQAEALTTFGTLDQTCDHHYAVTTNLSTLNVGSGPGNLPAGVYCTDDSFQLTTTLNLTGSGVWIFKTAFTLITSTGSSVTGGDPCNVWWRVGSSTTLNSTTHFIGTVISQTGVNAIQNSATLNGRFLALSGATVTLDTNTITGPLCNTTTATNLSASSITAGSTASDTATLSGTNSNTAGGTVTFNVYTDSACTSGTVATAASTVTGGVATSPAIPFPSAGTFYWQAVYAGDSYHSASTSVCNTEVLTVTAPVTSLPRTGFAPNRVTVLPAQPADKAYSAMGDLWLEIPKLGVQMNIVGVPQSNGTWDVSWLGNQAGWLNGSAFPTWAGNSVLTGHVWNADNSEGPFRYINTLWWGDKVIVHAWGAQYVYEVRSVQLVGPGNTDAMMKHEVLPWVTLVTCRGYDQASNSYLYRVLVRAVLLEVK